MLEWDREMATDVGQFCGKDSPGLARDLDRTLVRQRRRSESSGFATCGQHAPIKRCEMRSNETTIEKQPFQCWPEISERRTIFDIIPTNAVNVCVSNIWSWRPNQDVFRFNDLRPFPNDNRQTTGTVLSRIGRFEIDRGKAIHSEIDRFRPTCGMISMEERHT